MLGAEGGGGRWRAECSCEGRKACLMGLFRSSCRVLLAEASGRDAKLACRNAHEQEVGRGPSALCCPNAVAWVMAGQVQGLTDLLGVPDQPGA